jgi:hypothetical protein
MHPKSSWSNTLGRSVADPDPVRTDPHHFVILGYKVGILLTFLV